jgi:hypothetical protein
MLSMLQKLATDFLGLARVCGVLTASRWIVFVGRHFPDIVREGNLQPADKAMGEGPFTVRPGQCGASFAVVG